MQENGKDNFEDAVDSVSPRPLTEAVAPPPASTSDDAEVGKTSSASETESPHDSTVQSIETTTIATSHRDSSSTQNRLSQTSNLEAVELDDEKKAVPADDGTSPPASEAAQLKSNQGKNTDEDKGPTDTASPTKSLSLSSITSALPAMPWSPSVASPAKSPGAGPANAPPLPPVTTSSQPAPAPGPRRLTSPFTWLSRNSSKEKDVNSSPTMQPTGRRNTASSIATIISNPEMMLSKLEEESESGAASGEPTSSRNSLRDRFKLLRLQQEAGITMVPGEEDTFQEATPATTGAAAAANGEEVVIGDNGPLSPVPNPTDDLAPGTVSGVNAGPSAVQEGQVDWDLWQSVVYEGPAAVARTSPEELNRAIATGIPSAIRGVIWQVLAQSRNEELEAKYQELAARGTDKEKKRESDSASVASAAIATDKVTSSASSVHSVQSSANASESSQTDKPVEVSAKAQAAATAERKKKEKENTAALQKLEKVIRRDMGARTSYSKYAASAGLQDALFGVCKAYALYDEAVGYAQGMNFLIMPILFNMPEQEAFTLLVRLMNAYDLRDLFVQDMPGLHMRLYQFERLLEDVEPALYCHLHRRGISPHLYATQWFLTLFAYRFPLQLVLRIYDLILSEGLSAILRFGIVLMQKNSSTLLGISDMQQLTTYLKDKLFDVYIDKDPSQGSILENGFFGSSSSSIDKEVYRADQFVRDATEVKITQETLNAYTAEWQEKSRLEKERETELLELRLGNQNYAVQVRKLEERTEAGDREQADMANELVRTKVENEELKDENESLKGQVQELRVVIDKQPEELEEKWKLERDDLMKRNASVHEENTKLEKELADLEEQLVQTKLQYAEVRSTCFNFGATHVANRF